jgi:RNA polymerase sigma-70 factor (ECF subfamily)
MTPAGADRAADLAPVFDDHRQFLWSLGYRLTGNAADADDVVQETFVRALARPPRDRAREWRPWLVRVAVNIGRDLLRRRRRRGAYDGQWLPSPVETEPPAHEPRDETGGPAARYDLLESVSLAFLLALEALTPMQRAALLLRDVFDYSAAETARALGISAANARTVHLRARRALAAYDRERRPLTRERQRRERETLERFLACVTAGDVAGVEAMLAKEARAISDSAGEFPSNRVPIVGRTKVAALLVGIVKGLRLRRADVRVLNAHPAVVAEREPKAGFAPRWVTQMEFDESGLVTAVYTVLATRKLTRIGSGVA